MLLKCVDRSGYDQKNPWWDSTGDAFSFEQIRKTEVGEEKTGKEKTRDEDSDSSSLWGSVHGLCQEKQGPSKVGNLISAESCSRKRHSSGGRGADPQPWRTPKIYSPKTPPLLPLSKASMYLHSHSLQVRTTVHPPVFSDFPGLEFRPKIFVWEASHFTLAFAYRGEGQWKPGPTCHEKVTLVKSSIASKGPLSPSGSHNQHGWLQNEGSEIIKLLWWIQDS